MAEKLTHEEFDRRVEEAMKPQGMQGGAGFAPAIQKMRQIASKRRPQGAGRPGPIQAR